MKIAAVLVASFSLAIAARAQIVFTEIHYHPVEEPVFNADGTPYLNLTNDIHEFVEVQNISGSAVDVSGWTLGGGISYTFPSNAVIASGAFQVVALNPARLAAVYSLNATNILGPFSGHLSNGSDTVRLLDLAGNTIDAVAYDSKFPWAQAADALGASDAFTGLSSTNYQYKGRSLQRVSVTWPSSDPANWLASPLTGPTPGAAQAVTRAIPKPVVVAYSAVQTTNGATVIRSNQTVTVNCTYSATNGLTNVVIEYFVENVNLTNQSHTTLAMTNVSGATYTVNLPGQTNRAIVRYRFKADRGEGLEVVSPRADDPQITPVGTNNAREAWWGYYVTPALTTTNGAIYYVFVSNDQLARMANNITGSPKRVTLATALGLPRDIPYVAATAPQWDGTVPAVFCSDGQVWDIQIRYHGSLYHRAVTDHSFKVHFPKHQPLNGQSAWFETMHGAEFIEAQKINRLLGLPASQMRQVDWYFNATTNEVHGEQGEYSDYMLKAWADLQQQLNPGTSKEDVGDLYKCVGNRDTTQNNNEGPYTRGDEAPMLTNAGWNQLQRYLWTFTPEVNEWKGPKPIRDLIEGMWTARGDSPSTHTYTNTAASVATVKLWFTNNWDIQTTINSMAMLEWMSIWDDAAQNHYFWHRANGRWSRLGWDYDGVMSTASSGGGGGGGGGGTGGTTNQTIFGGEYGAATVFDGVNWWMDTFFKTYRSEYTRRLWELNNSFFDPTNLSAQGLTVAAAFAKGRQPYINSVLAATYGTYYKPNRPANVYPSAGGVITVATNFVTSAYSHSQSTPQLAAKWEIRTAAGTYEDPVLSITTTNSYLTNYPIPFDQLTYGQAYYWRATHIDTNGHPSVVSAETAFSWGTTNTAAGALVMNEILADNHSTVQNGGIYPDYLELYNNSSTNISLSGYSLTDDPANTTKFAFPATTILPGGYLLVWCDAQTAAPGLHTGFGLSKEGQTVLLMQNGTNIADSVTFGPQAPDVSIGRIVNGTGGWQANTPTPGTANSAKTLGSVSNLRVNEWMADPAYGEDWFELYNTDTNVVALAGLYLSDTPSTPMITQLPALSFIAGNGWTKFWADGSSAGGNHCNFSLSKSGESVVLTAANGATTIDTITFSAQASDVSQGRLPDGGTTIASFTNTASPGYCNWVATNAVINELMACSGVPLEDAIELYNTNSAAQDIGGWWLSNDPYNRKKFQIPSGTTLAAKSYKVFYAAGLASGAVPFEFNAAGGYALLSAVDGSGNLNGAASIVAFGAVPTNTSFGRVSATGLNATLGGAEFWPQSAHTFGQDNPADVATFRTGTGAANSSPKIGPVVINEIMYHPFDLTNITSTATNVSDDSRDEFIELCNVSTNTVDLSGWMLAGDSSFAFTNGTTLGSGSYLLLVSFDPTVATNLAAFKTYYGLSNNVTVYGPYSDKLPNNTAVVELACPMTIAGYVDYVIQDKVEYRDASPWPGKADGKGQSLSRASSSVIGNNAANWSSKAPTPGIINPGVVTNAVILTTSPLLGGVVNVPYTNAFVAVNGSAPYTWSIASGSVPGLSLSTNGVLTGTPTIVGANSLTVQLADGIGFTTNSQFLLVVADSAPAITNASPLLNGTNGVAYSQTLTASGGTSPYTWSLTGGSLPTGLSMNSAGVISGTPATNGTFNFTVQLADTYGLSASKAFSVTISTAPLAITTTSPMPGGQKGNYYSQALTAAGGVSPYAWTLAGGSLPGGLSLDPLGDIAGTPSTVGTFNFTVGLTDKLGTNLTKALAITIASPSVTITTTELPDGTVGTAYSETLAALGGLPPYAWAVTWEALPGGLSLSTAGVVSGTPTNAGTFSFILQATDSANAVAAQLYTVEIAHSVPVLSVAGYSTGVIQLLVSGDGGANFEIDATTNLVDWVSAFATNSAATPFSWTDTATNNATFYRVVLQP